MFCEKGYDGPHRMHAKNVVVFGKDPSLCTFVMKIDDVLLNYVLHFLNFIHVCEPATETKRTKYKHRKRKVKKGVKGAVFYFLIFMFCKNGFKGRQ